MKQKRIKKLTVLLPKNSGRNAEGKVTVRHQGGRQKRFLRLIDWKRNKFDVQGRVISIEYDPNRTADIALIQYTDGERRYILAPVGLKIGDMVMSGQNADVKLANALPLSRIPIGVGIHNIELHPGRGGQIVRSAGNVATVMSKEGAYAQIKLPSGEIRLVSVKAFATIGQLSNVEWKDEIIGTAGRARRMGIRPTVRGTAMNPRSHPHGGGEGRSGEGMPPKTPWGKPARGKRTRKHGKYSDKYIVQRRKK